MQAWARASLVHVRQAAQKLQWLRLMGAPLAPTMRSSPDWLSWRGLCHAVMLLPPSCKCNAQRQAQRPTIGQTAVLASFRTQGQRVQSFMHTLKGRHQQTARTCGYPDQLLPCKRRRDPPAGAGMEHTRLGHSLATHVQLQPAAGSGVWCSRCILASLSPGLSLVAGTVKAKRVSAPPRCARQLPWVALTRCSAAAPMLLDVVLLPKRLLRG